MSQFMKMYRFVDCVFSQPLLPWLHKSVGEGLIKSNGWLLNEVNVALIKRTEINLNPLLPCLCRNTSSRDATSLCCGARKCNSNKYCCSDFFAIAAVQAGWCIAKCGKKKQRQQLQDSKIVRERQKSTGAVACCCGWSCCFHQGRRGSFEGLTMPH